MISKHISGKSPVKSITIKSSVLTVKRLKQLLEGYDENLPISIYDRENREYYSIEVSNVSVGHSYVHYTTEYESGVKRNDFDWGESLNLEDHNG